MIWLRQFRWYLWVHTSCICTRRHLARAIDSWYISPVCQQNLVTVSSCLNLTGRKTSDFNYSPLEVFVPSALDNKFTNYRQLTVVETKLNSGIIIVRIYCLNLINVASWLKLWLTARLQETASSWGSAEYYSWIHWQGIFVNAHSQTTIIVLFPFISFTRLLYIFSLLSYYGRIQQRCLNRN